MSARYPHRPRILKRGDVFIARKDARSTPLTVSYTHRDGRVVYVEVREHTAGLVYDMDDEIRIISTGTGRS